MKLRTDTSCKKIMMRHALRFPAALVILGGATGAAWAQAEKATPVEEIVVTAGKLGNDMAKAPVTATSISAETLVRDHVVTIQDVAVRVPSLTTSSASGFSMNYIRGIGSSFSLAGQESSVATYVDGVYLERQKGGVLDLVDVSNVTVLKGPQGTLYGRNATGGAILVDTANPTDKFEGFVSGEYGKYDASRVQAVVNVPVSDTFAIRIAGQARNGGGYFRDLTSGKMRGDDHSYYIRAKAKWTPTDNFTAIYTIEYSKQKTTNYQQREIVNAPECIACAIYPNVKTATGPNDFFTTTMSTDGRFQKDRYVSNTLSLNYTADNFTVNSISGYRDDRSPLVNDSDNTAPSLAENTIDAHGPTFTTDNYLRTKFESPLNGLLGFSYLHDSNNQDFSLYGDIFGPAATHTTDKIRINSVSVYGELTYEFGGGFKVTGGARYNKDTKKIAVTNDATALAVLGIGGLPGAASFSRSATFNSVTPRAVISYENGGGYYYASYNRGERSGAFPGPLYSPALGAAKSERLDMFEIGAKNTVLDGHLHTAASAFYGKYKNIQVQILDNSTSTILLQNAASAKVKGVEFTADIDVTSDFTLSAGGTYLSNKFDRFPNAAVVAPAVSPPGTYPGVTCPVSASPLGFAACNEDLSHTRLPFAPSWSGFVSAQFQHEVADGWEGHLSATAKFTSSFDFAGGASGPLLLDRQKGYTLVDTTLSVVAPNGKTEFAFYCNNLFEAKHNDFVSSNTFGVYAVAGQPRMFGGRITQRF